MRDLFEDEENDVEIKHEFETRDLLAAVDVFDEMRTHLNDMGIARPPQMRGELLDLHQLAMEAYPNGSKEDLIKLYEDAENLESAAFELMEQAEKLHQLLESLMATEPEDLRGY
ncbi:MULTISPECIES: transposase [unclassified Arthrobacter]|uniref:transposase n=1 Tax=unclassified Arthrobacter TaxID=235627 RepID=UPI003391B0CC